VLAATLRLPTGHRATALAAHNGALSHLLFAATSDRALHVLDAARGAPVASVAAAHDRPVAALRLMPASPLAAHPPAAHACNLTAARDGAARLWDVRTMRPVRRFAAHANVQHAVGAALSPCGRWAAVGSEAREVVLYDVGSGRVHARLREVRSHALAPRCLCSVTWASDQLGVFPGSNPSACFGQRWLRCHCERDQSRAARRCAGRHRCANSSQLQPCSARALGGFPGWRAVFVLSMTTQHAWCSWTQQSVVNLSIA
jgi:hypothetical protein